MKYFNPRNFKSLAAIVLFASFSFGLNAQTTQKSPTVKEVKVVVSDSKSLATDSKSKKIDPKSSAVDDKNKFRVNRKIDVAQFKAKVKRNRALRAKKEKTNN